MGLFSESFGVAQDPETVKYTLTMYNFANNYELGQYLNRIISLSLCIFLHFAIIIRLLVVNKFRLISDYQILIIIQSFINLLASFAELVLNEIQTLEVKLVKIGHPFWQFSIRERLIFSISMVVTSNSTQDFLMLFNLHRLIMIRRKSLVKLYMIATPLMALGSCMDAIDSYPVVMRGEDINLFFKYSQIPFLAAIIFYCYWKLRKEFKTNLNYSEKTKKLQEKLSLSILLQVIILIIIAFIIAVIPVILEATVNENLLQSYAVYYTIGAILITQWYPLLSALLIRWSIDGFFKNHSAIGSVQQHSDGKIRPETGRKDSRTMA